MAVEEFSADVGEFWPGSVDDYVDDDLGLSVRQHSCRVSMAALTLLLVVAIPVAIGLGPIAISPLTVAKVITHHVVGWPAEVTWTGAQDAIVWQVRTPRVLLGAFVGAGLAITGVALQAMVRNVLADPYLLGVSSGASTGATAAILFGVGAGLGGFGVSSLSAAAFIGALAATAIVFVIARIGGRVTSVRLLLAGVAVGYCLSAATSFLIFASDSPEGARSVLFWLLGSLGSVVHAARLHRGRHDHVRHARRPRTAPGCVGDRR